MESQLRYDAPFFNTPVALIIDNRCPKPRRVKLFDESTAPFEVDGLMIYKTGMTENDEPYSVKNHQQYIDLIRSTRDKNIIIGKSTLAILSGPRLSLNADLFTCYIKYKNDSNRNIKCVERLALISPSQFQVDLLDTYYGIDEKNESEFELGESLEYMTFIVPAGQKIMFVFYASTVMPKERPIVIIERRTTKKNKTIKKSGTKT